jgi:hypothetical protein
MLLDWLGQQQLLLMLLLLLKLLQTAGVDDGSGSMLQAAGCQ